MSLLKSVSVAAAAVVGCDAAGFTSHNSAARRTSQFEYFGPASETFNPTSYFGLAADRPDAIQGGAPFPDYLYACGDEHDAGEEAHWTPFQMAAADYIRSTYPNWETEGRDAEGPGLVAFMLGVTSHYIADINWHGLETVPAAEGLIRSMGFADFRCTDGDLCQVAHSAADTGGEFAAASMLDVSWYPNDKWYVPTDDLVNIYAIMNATGQGPLVEAQWINECAVIFYAGSWALAKFGDLAYPVLAPYLGSTLLEQYLDFHLGGIDDDAAWTGFMQNRFADWVSNGPPDEPPNFQTGGSVLESSRNLRSTRRLAEGQLQRGLVQSLRKIFADDKSFLQATSTGASKSGSFIGFSGDVSKAQEDLVQRIADAVINDYAVPLLRTLGGDQAVAASEADIEQAREKIQQRAKQLTSGAKELQQHEISEEFGRAEVDMQQLYHGQEAHEYFGHSVTVADFSGSGKECDVLVGSYGAGRTGGPQEGVSRILFNTACGSGTGRGEEATDILLFRGGRARGGADAEPSYERFGWSSAAADVNADGYVDAVICAPSFGGKDVEAVVGNYTGRCDIYFGPFSPSSDNSSPPAPDASIYGDSKWGTFGDVVTAGDIDGDGHADLIISAPGAGSYPDLAPDAHGELSNQGAVYVFLARTISATLAAGGAHNLMAMDTADKVLQPTGSYGWFGKSLTVTSAVDGIDPLLIVGSPTYHPQGDGLTDDDKNSAVGRIFLYSVGSVEAVSSLVADDYTRSVSGCGHAGRTGQTVAFSAALAALAVAEPSFNVTTRSVLERGEALGKSVLGQHGLRAGRVVVISLSSLFGSQSKDMLLCDFAESESDPITISGRDVEGRFGLSLSFGKKAAEEGKRGRGSEDTLLIGAPLARDGVGSVFGYTIKSSEMKRGLSAVPSFLLRGDKFDGEKKSRFGRAIAPIASQNSSELSFFVSAPLADLGFAAPDNDQRGRLFKVHVVN